ncbi:hypothetical protein ADL00_39955 [Streptomyces sp. AS58]|uniref:SpoIIE family protein phosphatase n=1 Tax=Streptomyces sp. AS58 TaxID=1519489 RepID=UPI0006BF68C4|nr:SpoIIE family protein phosphatase [Streptomyces sp. AS58]KOV51767.1 hypothetical protein ADL00_39955 [Streptomyces sp. AS58]
MGASDATERGGHDRVDPAAEDRARVLIDAGGVVVGWNSAAERLLDRPADAMLGRPVVDPLDGADPFVPPEAAEDDVLVGLRRTDGAFVPCRIGVRRAGAGEEGARWEVTLTPAGRATSTAELDHALLETLFTVSPVGLYLLDPQLRIIRFNPAAEGMERTSVAEAVGRRPAEVWPSADVENMERVMEQVLATGRPAIGVEKRMRPPGDPEHEHVLSASVFPLVSEQGRVLGLADATVDVTDHHLARERLNALALAGKRIGSSLDVLDTTRGLAEVSVPGLADSMAVEVLEPVLAGEDLEPGPVRPDTVLRRAACRSRDDAELTAAGVCDGVRPPANAAETLHELEPRIIDPRSALGRRLLAGLRAPRHLVHSLMLVPLVVQSRALGLAMFCRWGDRRPFEQDDVTLAAELALRTAACLDNARRYLRERNSLVALQHAMRSDGLPPRDTLDAAHEYAQAGSGGDWVDVLALSGARVALVAGRVPGRGLETAAAAGRLRAAVHTLSDLDLEPDELLARLDDLARRFSGGNGDGTDHPSQVRDAGRSDDADEAFTTCLYLIYDPVSGRCSVASAGHPWPVLVQPDGTVAALDRPTGAVLRGSGGPFERTDLDLPDNSTLVMYTPGFCQERSDAQVRKRVTELLDGFSGTVRQACGMLIEALIPDRPREDAAVQVARTHTLSSARVKSWDLPSDPSVVSRVRSLVTGQLTTWGMSQAAFTTELIASELVTNAIRYAKPPLNLRLIRSHVLTCEVSDGSSTSPRLRHARITDEGGRGLLLAARFSERWGTRYTDDGKTVWVEQSIPELHRAGDAVRGPGVRS